MSAPIIGGPTAAPAPNFVKLLDGVVWTCMVKVLYYRGGRQMTSRRQPRRSGSGRSWSASSSRRRRRPAAPRCSSSTCRPRARSRRHTATTGTRRRSTACAARSRGRSTAWPPRSAPGEVLCIPRGAVHRFENHGPELATQLAVVTPGLLGPAYFRDLAATVISADGPPDVAAIARRDAPPRAHPARPDTRVAQSRKRARASMTRNQPADTARTVSAL